MIFVYQLLNYLAYLYIGLLEKLALLEFSMLKIMNYYSCITIPYNVLFFLLQNPLIVSLALLRERIIKKSFSMICFILYSILNNL